MIALERSREQHRGGRFEPGEGDTRGAKGDVWEGCYARCRGVCMCVRGVDGRVGVWIRLWVFKGDPEGAEEVTGGELWGGEQGECKEKCTLTFLECPPHCSRLMRQGRERMVLLQARRQDKTWRVADGTGRLSSRRRNSKHRTWEHPCQHLSPWDLAKLGCSAKSHIITSKQTHLIHKCFFFS